MPRPLIAVLTALSLSAVACGGGSGDDAAAPTTRLTLLPTTTTTLPASTTSVAPEDSTPSTEVAVTTPAVATTTTVAVATTTTAPVDAAVETLVLSEDGIGAAVFSGDPDGVVTFLSSFIGAPSADTGWVDPFTISACAGTELRVVSWGGLRLTFGDVSPVLEGRRHFFAYSYGTYTYDGVNAVGADQTPIGLVTDRGIGLGTDLLTLEAAYAGLQLNPADDFFPETFVVNDNFRGAITGLADGSTVVNLVGGQDCTDPT